jgi:hypothetical protein
MRQSKIFFFLLAAAVSITSCLKKDRMNIDTNLGPKNVVEFDNTGSNMAKVSSKFPGFYSDLGVLSLGESKTFNINVSYSGVDVAPQDITVKLELDQAALDKYNEDNGTSLEIPPSDVVSFPSTVVIKQGQRSATVTATVTLSNSFDFDKAYGLPLKIASATTGTISQNFGKVVYSFGVRNKYDGIYKLTGHHNRVPYNYPYEVTMHMVTVGPNSVIFYWPDVQTYGHPIGVGPDPVNDVSWYGGGIAPVVVFDPATDKVVNVYNSGGATPITMFTGAGSRVSLFDPATHNITVDWNYNNNPLRAFFDNLEYIGPR